MTLNHRTPRGHYLALDDSEEPRLVPLPDKISHFGDAVIVRHGRHARVLDNHSTSGTFLNGRRIVATNVIDGDVISVGDQNVRYIVID